MKKWSRRVLLVVIAVIVMMQVVRPAKTNPPSNPKDHIQASLPVHPELIATFSRACNDCHSNNTVWPWYSNVAPFSWVLVNDVKEGRNALNFSEWGTYGQEKQRKLLGEICEQVREGEMPGMAYSLAHRRARLNDADRAAICSWTRTAGAGVPRKDDDEGDAGETD